jgi:transcriptional regulator with XRE-family HTH domain
MDVAVEMPADTDQAHIKQACSRVLRQLRADTQQSQQTIARAAPMDRSYLSMLERGLRLPSLTIMLRLGPALGVGPTQLMDRIVRELRT